MVTVPYTLQRLNNEGIQRRHLHAMHSSTETARHAGQGLFASASLVRHGLVPVEPEFLGLGKRRRRVHALDAPEVAGGFGNVQFPVEFFAVDDGGFEGLNTSEDLLKTVGGTKID